MLRLLKPPLQIILATAAVTAVAPAVAADVRCCRCFHCLVPAAEAAAAAALQMQLTAKDAAVAAAPRNLLPQMLPQLQLVQAAVSTCGCRCRNCGRCCHLPRTLRCCCLPLMQWMLAAAGTCATTAAATCSGRLLLLPLAACQKDTYHQMLLRQILDDLKLQEFDSAATLPKL